MLESDVALDARLTFDGMLQQGGTITNAIAAVMDEFKDALDDNDDHADLILALAWLASEKRAVPDWLEVEAPDVLESGHVLERWEDTPYHVAREEAESLLLAILDGTMPHPGRIGNLRPGDSA